MYELSTSEDLIIVYSYIKSAIVIKSSVERTVDEETLPPVPCLLRVQEFELVRDKIFPPLKNEDIILPL